jgi:hypothetical protein
MTEAIAIYLLFVVAMTVIAVIGQLLGYEFKGEHTSDSDRKKGWDPSEHHQLSQTQHWNDNSHHHDHSCNF